MQAYANARHRAWLQGYGRHVARCKGNLIDVPLLGAGVFPHELFPYLLVRCGRRALRILPVHGYDAVDVVPEEVVAGVVEVEGADALDPLRHLLPRIAEAVEAYAEAAVVLVEHGRHEPLAVLRRRNEVAILSLHANKEEILVPRELVLTGKPVLRARFESLSKERLGRDPGPVRTLSTLRHEEPLDVPGARADGYAAAPGLELHRRRVAYGDWQTLASARRDVVRDLFLPDVKDALFPFLRLVAQHEVQCAVQGRAHINRKRQGRVVHHRTAQGAEEPLGILRDEEERRRSERNLDDF